MTDAPLPSLRAREPVARVLIVDDNVELVGALKAVLTTPHATRAQLSVVTAARGEEALVVARREGFDVAIVDVKLPDASGVDLIQPLRDASPFGEVLLITGFASVDAAIGALQSGAFAFVLKSFRPEELISIVEQALTKVELKREREELERRYRDLVELTDVLVVALDADGAVALLNRKASTLSGITPEKAHAQPFVATFIPSEDRAAMQNAITAATNEPRPREVETGFLGENARSGASKLRVRWHLSPAREEGALVYGIGVDVTERRALERRAADAEALSAMGTLAMNLAHEIRNPLNAAVLQLHLLSRDVDKIDCEPETRESLKRRAAIVGDEVSRLSRLLSEFLELARPRGIAREPVHMGRLVEGVLDLQRDAAHGRGIAIVRDLAPDGCVAIGDAEKLKQVVLNLVVNAIEAMKSGGTLTGHVASAGDHVRVTIEDSGPGIPADVRDNVFDPFFTTKEAGTGLGLSIVRKIVDQHAGTVAIESEPDRGTRVIVEIPTRR